MKKTRIIIAAIGGTCVLITLVLAYLAFDSFSTGVETQEELLAMESAIGKYVKADVKPMQASVDAVDQNRQAYANWIEEAKTLARRGDKEFAPTTDAAFKTFMVSEAKRMSALPGGANGKLVQDDFPFGFKNYILDGAMPPAAELPKLQRQWDDVTTVVSTLADAGVYELTSLKLLDDAPTATPAAAEAPKGRKRGAAKPAKAAAAESPMDITVMAVEFTTRPSGLVGVLNRFAESERFTVVDQLQFVREKDDLAETLGGEKKAEVAAPAPSGRGRGRGRRAVEAVEAEEPQEDDAAKKGQLVTDPSRASLLKVSMIVKLIDFKSLVKEEVKE